MIDAFVVETVAASAVGFGVLLAARRRPKTLPITGLIRRLPRRHRRDARKIVRIARAQVDYHAEATPQAFTAREMLRAYLPETLAAYLRVPRAERAIRQAGRSSPDQELKRQLLTLRSGLEHVRAADAERAMSLMAANGAFLNERFGPVPFPPRSQAASIAEIVDAVTMAVRSRRS